MAMAPDIVAEFGLALPSTPSTARGTARSLEPLALPSPRTGGPFRGQQLGLPSPPLTARSTREQRPRTGNSCGYNYLRERREELGKVRASRTPSVPVKDIGLLSRQPRKVPPALAASIKSGSFWKAPPPMDKASHTYQWTPVNVRQLDPSVGGRQYVSALEEAKGTYVTTLTFNVRKETFEDAPAHFLRLDSGNFVPCSGKPWCYMLKGSSPFVLVRGVVERVGTPEATGPVLLGRLPEGLRPLQPLRFAALARQAVDTGGHSSRLITILVQPSGEILTDMAVGSSVDLSAIRFSSGRGISLIDGVCLYILDAGGTRLACLQGSLTPRFFELHGRKLIALLPDSCRPPRTMHFVTSGEGGGFHLMMVRPSSAHTTGANADLTWQDGTWTRDRINMNGIMFEVAPTCLEHPNPLEARSVTEAQAIAIVDFKRYILRRFGSVETAWNEVFDIDGSGSVNFTEFGLGCKTAGYVGNTTRLWAALDEDLSGEISMDELDLDAEGLLATVRAKAAAERAVMSGNESTISNDGLAKRPALLNSTM